MLASRHQNLEHLVKDTEHLLEVRKSDLREGDLVIVHTLNATYSILFAGENKCLVSGGWFDRNEQSPFATTIRGCTWGGSAIKQDLVAACGLCLEFGNQVVTSPAKKIFVVPRCLRN